jgi:hypothetical protein
VSVPALGDAFFFGVDDIFAGNKKTAIGERLKTRVQEIPV